MNCSYIYELFIRLYIYYIYNEIARKSQYICVIYNCNPCTTHMILLKQESTLCFVHQFILIFIYFFENTEFKIFECQRATYNEGDLSKWISGNHICSSVYATNIPFFFFGLNYEEYDLLFVFMLDSNLVLHSFIVPIFPTLWVGVDSFFLRIIFQVSVERKVYSQLSTWAQLPHRHSSWRGHI